MPGKSLDKPAHSKTGTTDGLSAASLFLKAPGFPFFLNWGIGAFDPDYLDPDAEHKHILRLIDELKKIRSVTELNASALSALVEATPKPTPAEGMRKTLDLICEVDDSPIDLDEKNLSIPINQDTIMGTTDKSLLLAMRRKILREMSFLWKSFDEQDSDIVEVSKLMPKPIRLMEKEELLLERQKVLDLLKMGFETEVDLDLPHQLDSNRDQAVAALRKKQELRFKPLQQLLKEVDNEVDQLPGPYFHGGYIDIDDDDIIESTDEEMEKKRHKTRTKRRSGPGSARRTPKEPSDDGEAITDDDLSKKANRTREEVKAKRKSRSFAKARRAPKEDGDLGEIFVDVDGLANKKRDKHLNRQRKERLNESDIETEDETRHQSQHGRPSAKRIPGGIDKKNPVVKKLLKRIGKMLSQPIEEALKIQEFHDAFAYPVNREHAPDYDQIIKEPMDLGKLKEMLRKLRFDSFNSFWSAVTKIHDNCVTYCSERFDNLIPVAKKFLEYMKEAYAPLKEKAQYLFSLLRTPDSPEAIRESEADVPKGRKGKDRDSADQRPWYEKAKEKAPTPANKKKWEDIFVEKLSEIITEIYNAEVSFEFRSPIDRTVYKDYDQIVTDEMNLSRIRKKAERRQYHSLSSMQHDLRKIRDNCIAYCKGRYDSMIPIAEKFMQRADEAIEPHKKELETLDYLINRHTAEAAEQHASSAKATRKTSSMEGEGNRVNRADTKKMTKTSDNKNHKAKEIARLNAKLLKIVARLRKNRKYQAFDIRVDPAAAPDYYEVVRQPMYLRSLEKKLKQNMYTSTDDFLADFALIRSNCRLYCTDRFPDLPPIADALQQEVEAEVEKLRPELARIEAAIQTLEEREKGAVEKTLIQDEVPAIHKEEEMGASMDLEEAEEKDTSNKILQKIEVALNNPEYTEFVAPVDTNTFSDYHLYVNTPMDLSTMRNKAVKNAYKSMEDVMKDAALIRDNCLSYSRGRFHLVEEAAKSLAKYVANELDVPLPPAKPSKRTTELAGTPKSTGKPKEKVRFEGNEDDQRQRGLSRRDSGLNKTEQTKIQVEQMPPSERRVQMLSIANNILLSKVLLRMKDKAKCSAFTTDPSGLEGYKDVIEKPMDLSRMMERAKSSDYGSLEEFKSDLALIRDNCEKFCQGKFEGYPPLAKDLYDEGIATVDSLEAVKSLFSRSESPESTEAVDVLAKQLLRLKSSKSRKKGRH